MIEDGVIPPFYNHKLHVQHYSAPVLILNILLLIHAGCVYGYLVRALSGLWCFTAHQFWY